MLDLNTATLKSMLYMKKSILQRDIFGKSWLILVMIFFWKKCICGGCKEAPNTLSCDFGKFYEFIVKLVVLGTRA